MLRRGGPGEARTPPTHHITSRPGPSPSATQHSASKPDARPSATVHISRPGDAGAHLPLAKNDLMYLAKTDGDGHPTIISFANYHIIRRSTGRRPSSTRATSSSSHPRPALQDHGICVDAPVFVFHRHDSAPASGIRSAAHERGRPSRHPGHLRPCPPNASLDREDDPPTILPADFTPH